MLSKRAQRKLKQNSRHNRKSYRGKTVKQRFDPSFQASFNMKYRGVRDKYAREERHDLQIDMWRRDPHVMEQIRALDAEDGWVPETDLQVSIADDKGHWTSDGVLVDVRPILPGDCRPAENGWASRTKSTGGPDRSLDLESRAQFEARIDALLDAWG